MSHKKSKLRRCSSKSWSLLVIMCAIGLLQENSCKQLRVHNSNESGGIILYTKSSVPTLTTSSHITPLINSQNESRFASSITEKSQVPLAKNSSINAAGSHQQHLQQKPSNYSVLNLVRSIDTRLRNIRNAELGITTIQEIFDAMEFTAVVSETDETLMRFSDRLKRKLQKASMTIQDLRRFFDSNITSIIKDSRDFEKNNSKPLVYLNTIIQPCSFEDFSLEQNYNKRQIQILNYFKNNKLANEGSLSFSINRMILEEIRLLNVDSYNFKQIYFLSNDDFASDHNCQYYFENLNFRHLYASAVQRKRIFILIDVSSVLSVEQMELSKKFVSTLVQMLSNTDVINIVTLSDEAVPMVLDEENRSASELNYLATPDNKEEILDFIARLKRSTEPTNHSLGFMYAFNFLRQQNLSESDPLEFIYVTRGLLTRLWDAKSVLSAIALGQQSLSFPIIINTCAVILDEKRIMYEKQFLNDIVHQNYTKYDINVSDWYSDSRNLTGNLYIITKRNPERIIKTSTAVLTNLFKRHGRVDDTLQIHLPVVDFNSQDVIVSITQAIQGFGLIGVNLYLADLAEDILTYKNDDNSYVCLIDTTGVAILHPASQNAAYFKRNPLPVDIANLENSTNFLDLRKLMLEEDSGNLTLQSNPVNGVNKTYKWQRVLDMYIILIVTTMKPNGKAHTPQYETRFGNGLNKFQHTEYATPSDLLYHRIDLIPPRSPVCRYFRQIATLESGTVFLSASSFQSPFTYMKNNRVSCDNTKTHTVQSIMAYIKDSTGLLANPGLLPRIRSDVSVLYSVMEYLKKRHFESREFKNYVIRRYAATISGVLQVFPGCILPTDFDPSQRPWFRKAMLHPGRIVVSEPYLDAGGAGYILTIAHTIFEGKANALHNSERDAPAAIVGLDVPYAFFYKLILDAPMCQEENIKCILFENEGYLIAHPSMMEAVSSSKNMRRPYEHLTHKESFLANDILNHNTLVTKLACANYQNRTVQRYYSFNTSLTEVLTNVVHGERTKYQITAVWGTNIFAAVLNSTCDGGAFCPCSTVDRICLNCNRMDQTDCECPCECPMQMKARINLSSGADEEYELFRSYTNRFSYCKPQSNGLVMDISPSYDWNMVLNSCIHINCDVYTNHIDCLAVMGCEWCQLDLDGNPISTSFCTTQNSCFNGVLSSVTPYGDGELGSIIFEPPKIQPYSALGPVGGAIIVLCLVIGFAMYCYRQSLETNGEQFYVDSMHDDNYGVPLSRFNFDNIPPPDDGDIDGLGDGHGCLHRNLVNPIGNAIAVSDISPYHMSTGSSYRRPPNGESDHGYSTMTPHEDSEHMCFTLAEPLINNKRLSKSDSLSISTSVSSPTNHNTAITVDRPVSSMGMKTRSTEHRYNTPKNSFTQGQTVLGDCNKESEDHQQTSPHHILARVTVHRHMEAL